MLTETLTESVVVTGQMLPQSIMHDDGQVSSTECSIATGSADCQTPGFVLEIKHCPVGQMW